MERGKDIPVVLLYNTSRPGMLIGRSGEGVEKLRKDIEKKLNVKILVFQRISN